MGLRTAERTMRYPDVSVYCGPLGGADDQRPSEPRVIIEVLSPSTADHDQNVKLLEYQRLFGVQEVMFADPMNGAVRVVRRTGGDDWSARWLRGDENLEFASIDVISTRSELGLPG